MADQAVLPAKREAAPPGTGDPADDDLESLRAILIGPTEGKVRTIEARLDDRFAQARDVGAVLPQALLQRSNDPELARALSPPVERAITASVRRDPKPLADALFPVIGPAIRKAVAASLASMVESLNRTVEQSVSWRALRWRLEAWRTGRSFGEIVLLKTLLYRVEQVFLIHRKTGLLLQQVRAGPAHVEDAQLVSAMLTAIRDFVQDSFRVADDEGLDALKVGELSVWVEQGPSAILAAVIRGSAPQDRRLLLQRTLERIHLDFGEPLASFDGDAAPFESARPLLEECLEAEFRPEARGRRRGALIVFALALLVAGIWAAFAVRDQRRWNRYVEALRSEPGLVLISTGRADGKYVVSGLRDPLARDPAAIREASLVASDDVVERWEPYQALQPPFVLARAKQVLQPPAGTELRLQQGMLFAEGGPPMAWIADAQRLAPLIPGVTGFDRTSAIEGRIRSLARDIESSRLLFVRGTSRLVDGQDAALDTLAATVRELAGLAAAADRRMQLEVVGHTDADGAPVANVPLSRARAEQAIRALGLQTTAHLDVRTAGVGSDAPLVVGASEADKQQNRRVAFRLSDAAAAPEGPRR